MRRVRVALTMYHADAGDVHLPVEYVDSLRRAGAEPLLVAPGAGDPESLLDGLDALVLAGGGDIDPSAWSGPQHPSVYMTDPARDTTELTLARYALEAGLPILAICRGMQVLNVALGGTLHVHVPDVFGDTVAHRLPPREPTPHRVRAASGSLVADTMRATRVDAMSWHHQAVDALGAGLRTVAWADDGLIEAVELDASRHTWCVGVQWHPELSAGEDPTQQALFDGLVQACRRATTTRSE